MNNPPKVKIINGEVHCNVCDNEVYVPTPEGSYAPCYCEPLRKKYAKLKKIFSSSKIPRRYEHVDLQNYPNKKQNKSVFDALQKYAQDGEINGKNSLFIHGRVGIGKTGVSTAILRERMKKMVPGLFIESNELMGRIRASFNQSSEYTEDEIIDAIKTVEFLVFDDLGTEKVSDWVKSKLFEIINARYNNLLPTVITSNLTMEQVARQYGDRLTDRLREMSVIFELKGDNLRN